MLKFHEPLRFDSEVDGERAFTAPWDKDAAKAAFGGPGFYLASVCLHWLDLEEMPGEFCSWRSIIICAKEFWPRPNPNPPHLTGWVKDPSVFATTVMPKSIKVRGAFELLAGLALQLHKCSDQQLQLWKPMMRSMVITVYGDGPHSPLKGLAIKQATEMSTREATQAVTPVQQAMMIHDP